MNSWFLFVFVSFNFPENTKQKHTFGSKWANSCENSFCSSLSFWTKDFCRFLNFGSVVFVKKVTHTTKMNFFCGKTNVECVVNIMLWIFRQNNWEKYYFDYSCDGNWNENEWKKFEIWWRKNLGDPRLNWNYSHPMGKRWFWWIKWKRYYWNWRYGLPFLLFFVCRESDKKMGEWGLEFWKLGFMLAMWKCPRCWKLLSDSKFMVRWLSRFCFGLFFSSTVNLESETQSNSLL